MGAILTFRKVTVIFIISILFISIFTIEVSANQISELKKSINELKVSLSETARADLEYLGVANTDINSLSKVDMASMLNLVLSKFSSENRGPMSVITVLISVLIIDALVMSYKDGLRQSSFKEVLALVSTLCVTSVLVFPVIDLINDCLLTVKDASNFMLLYIPVMVTILAFSGHAVSGASYYSCMVMACQGISRLSSVVIAPLLNVYMSFCISASLTHRVNLKGFCDMFSKFIKWLIAFSMTIFSALLTIRSMITTAYDSVTTRAVRFTMSSFIPIVGAALSESYKTIQGSINLLRTGAGVFVILAIFVVFLPTIARCIMWLFAIGLCKSVAQLLGVTNELEILSSVNSVVSTVFAVIMSVLAVFIISTALLITLGGGV